MENKKQELQDSFENFMVKLKEIEEDVVYEKPEPCPICGGEYEVSATGFGGYRVKCSREGCIEIPGVYEGVEKAVKHWNVYVQQHSLDFAFMKEFCNHCPFEFNAEKRKLRSYWTTFCEHYKITPRHLTAVASVRKVYLNTLWDAVDFCGWDSFEEFQKYLDKWMRV